MTQSDANLKGGGSSEYSNKMNGLLETPLYKKIRNAVFNLYSYVYSNAPPFYVLHTVMTYYRLYQFLFSAFYASKTSLWDSTTLPAKIVNFCNIVANFCPIESHLDASVIFIYVYFGLNFIFLGLTLGSAFIYQKTSQLPFFISRILVLYISSFGYFLHPLIGTYVGEYFGALIQNNYNKNLVASILGIVLSVAVLIIYVYLYIRVFSFSIQFRPNSFPSLTPIPQVIVFSIVPVVNLFSGFASNTKGALSIVFIVLCIILSLGLPVSLVIYGGFIRSNVEIISASSTYVLLSILAIVYDLMKKKADELFLIIPIILLFIFYFVWKYVITKIYQRALTRLDIFQETDDITVYSNYSNYLNDLNIGFIHCHPVCINFKFPQRAVAQWPDKIYAWFAYAKYLAIYPEESQTLISIIQSINQNEIKGPVAKQTCGQIEHICLSRESNLSVSLKGKLNKVIKLTTASKHKLRHVWDMVIQGNLSELEGAIWSVDAAIEKADAEFIHLVGDYPNNRFVVRAYSRFLIEVKGDIEEYSKFNDELKVLQRGINAVEDQTHELGIHDLPALPSTIKDTSQSSMTPTNTEDLFSMQEDNTLNDQLSEEQTISLSNRVKSLLLPSFKLLLIVKPLMILVLTILPLLIFEMFLRSFANSMTNHLHHVEQVSQLHISSYVIALYTIQICVEFYSYCYDPFYDDELFLSELKDMDLKYLGGTTDSFAQLQYIAVECTNLLSQMSELKSIASKELFEEKIDFATFPLMFQNSVNLELSVFSSVSNLVSLADYILDQLLNYGFKTKIPKSIFYNHSFNIYNISDKLIPMIVITFESMINNQLVKNLVFNLDVLEVQSRKGLDLVINYVQDHARSSIKLMTIVMIVLCIAVPIILFITIYLISRSINHDKSMIFNSLTTIPKNVVSSVADKLRVIKKSNTSTMSLGSMNGTSSSNGESDVTKQEENALKIFATANDSTNHAKTSTLNGIAIIINSILFIAGVLVLGLSLINSEDSVANVAPQIGNLYSISAYYYAILVQVYMIGGAQIDNQRTLKDKKGKELNQNYTTCFFHENKLYNPYHEATEPTLGEWISFDYFTMIINSYLIGGGENPINRFPDDLDIDKFVKVLLKKLEFKSNKEVIIDCTTELGAACLTVQETIKAGGPSEDEVDSFNELVTKCELLTPCKDIEDPYSDEFANCTTPICTEYALFPAVIPWILILMNLKSCVPNPAYLPSTDADSRILYTYLNVTYPENPGNWLPSCGLVRHFNATKEMENIRNNFQYASSAFSEMRFGNKSKDVEAFGYLNDALIENANKTTKTDDEILTSDYSKFALHDIYKDMPINELFSLVNSLVYQLLVPFQENVSYVYHDPSNNIDVTKYHSLNQFFSDDEIVHHLHHIIIYHLYNNFFAPLQENVVSTLSDQYSSSMTLPMVVVSLICAVTFIFEIILIVLNYADHERIKFALMLPLQCPISVTLSNPKIMALYNGHFEQKKGTTTRDNTYFKEIIRNMPDLIVIFDENENLISINIAAQRGLGLKGEPGSSARELFLPSTDSEEKKTQKLELFNIIFPNNNGSEQNNQTNQNQNRQNGFLNQNQGEECKFTRDDGIVFDLRVIVQRNKSGTVVIMKDITQEKRYNTLIAEEGAKSDMLLASILPPKLVPKVRAGEKGISFAVQSATISFIDIVEFTPWCASLEADQVMATLNDLYSRFDKLLNKYPTMTRIKCIGDCYMTAGGIFAEINQPQVHAKEVVEFGLDVISTVQELDKEKGMTLRVRVGINTGGPIVAGVLGIGKPTFEIIGSPISMAQQMEHHGVPMNVHISRSVYELIYGGQFEIKERGEIEIKSGPALTYLVISKNSKPIN